MDVQQKIYSVVLAIEEASEIRSANKPILLHYDARYIKNVPQYEAAQILGKFAEDEKVIDIVRVPQWVNEAYPFIAGPLEIEESFQLKLLPSFKEYAEGFHKKFEGYTFNEELGHFERSDAKAIVSGRELKIKTDLISAREKNTFLKLILGMAVAGYSYDPKKPRNSAIGKISNDLESLGISVDSDTIRKWLKEASEVYSITLPEEDR